LNGRKKGFYFKIEESRMDLPRYITQTGRKRKVYQFISEGINGRITKRVYFQETTLDNYVSLLMGDYDPKTGEIDFYNISNNGDRDKILATIVDICYNYFELYPNHIITFTGANEARTRLYQMAISKYFDELSLDFHIFGELNKVTEPFRKKINYTSFYISLK
jgi:hypothetical protein